MKKTAVYLHYKSPKLNTMILSHDRKRVTAKPTPTLPPKPGKHKRANKDAKIYVGWSTTVLIHYLRNQKRFYWSVPKSVVVFYARARPTSEQKKFVEFRNYFLLFLVFI